MADDELEVMWKGREASLVLREEGDEIKGYVGKKHALTVDRDLELMGVLESANRLEVGPNQGHLKLIVPVQRERLTHAESADGPERQPFLVLTL